MGFRSDLRTLFAPYRGTSVFGDKKLPLFKRCSVQHDDDYATRRVSRYVADERFRLCMAKIIDDLDADPNTVRQYRRAARMRYRIVKKLGWIMYYT